MQKERDIKGRSFFYEKKKFLLLRRFSVSKSETCIPDLEIYVSDSGIYISKSETKNSPRKSLFLPVRTSQNASCRVKKKELCERHRRKQKKKGILWMICILIK